MIDDPQLLDQVQGIYDHLWNGGECDVQAVRGLPGPLIELQVRPLTKTSRKKLPARRQIKRRRVPRLI